MISVALTINGRDVGADVEPRTHLADFLRDTQNLTGTHLGCEHGVCGACTVLIDGVPVRSCITYPVACMSAQVTTIEGLDEDEIMKELRTAFSREHALQCGYCTPGMLISARDAVLRLVDADERAIRVAMSGNLCRCTGYSGIVRAIELVISDRRGRGIAHLPGAGRKTLGPAGASGASAPRRDYSPPPGAAAKDAQLLFNQTGGLADWKPQATFDQSFVVHHPVDTVWTFFADMPEVTACLPGASLTGDTSGRTVTGKMRVRVGPIVADFHGSAEIERDAVTRSGSIIGSGSDQRSSSATRGVVTYRLLPAGDGGTKVLVSVGYRLTGPLAQFSRSGLVQEIAGRLVAAFAQNVEARLRGAPPSVTPRELRAGRLLFSALAQSMKMRVASLLGKRSSKPKQNDAAPPSK